MLHSVFRLIPWIIIIAVATMFLKKRKKIKKRLMLILIFIMWTILSTVSALFPVENLFIDFSSPESVFNYYCVGHIEDIVYGSNSCLIVYATGKSSYSHIVIPKSESGYKIPSLFSTKTLLSIYGDGIDVIHELNSNDYFLIGLTASNEEEMSITDSNNKEVKSIVRRVEGSDYSSVLLYCFAENFDNEYYIMFNGKKISFSSDS